MVKVSLIKLRTHQEMPHFNFFTELKFSNPINEQVRRSRRITVKLHIFKELIVIVIAKWSG